MKKNNKGFTLAELLIVVAIIAVLVAIAIPVFNSQLEKSRDSVTASNIRAAYAEAASKYLVDGTSDTTGSKEQQTIKSVVVKGQLSNGYFDSADLPFSLGDGVKEKLDNGKTTSKYDATFEWTINKTTHEVDDKPTLTLKASGGSTTTTPGEG